MKNLGNAAESVGFGPNEVGPAVGQALGCYKDAPFAIEISGEVNKNPPWVVDDD